MILYLENVVTAHILDVIKMILPALSIFSSKIPKIYAMGGDWIAKPMMCIANLMTRLFKNYEERS